MISLSSLRPRFQGPTGATGATGANGKEVELQNDGTYLQWRYVGDAAWNNLITLVDLVPEILPNPTKELFNNGGAIDTATINLDLKNKQIYYYADGATGNFTVNFRGDSSTSIDTLLDVGETIACTLIVKNGANAYLANVIKVDSTTNSAYWFDPSPAGTPNGLDVYSFTILKTASATFQVIVNIAPAATL